MSDASASSAPERPRSSDTGRAAAPDDGWTSRFRILKRRGWKAGFRLEQAFWEALEEAAAAKGLRLAELVWEAAREPPADAGNRSSALRVLALKHLQAERRRLLGLLDPSRAAAIALAAPTPCFVLDANRRLVAHNAEFQSLVVSLAQPAPTATAPSANLTLDAPVARLLEVLAAQPRKALICGYVIHVEGRGQARGEARVTILHTSDKPLLVGYILRGPVTR